MRQVTAARGIRRKRRSPRARRAPPARLWPKVRSSAHWWRVFRGSSTVGKLISGALLLATVSLAVNWIYQVARKPTELFFPVSGVLYKTPAETWQQYSSLFEKYSTAVMTPGLLAAIAQIEGSGNPIVRTYWRWSWSSQPFEVYRPASSAVGMYKFTDGTFAQAKRFCVREHTVVENGPWNHGRTCWLNGLYARIVPADAVEMAAAYLDHGVAVTLARHAKAGVSLRHEQELATLIHLCGAGTGDAFARRGFRLTPGQRCGDHDARAYLARVAAMKSVFDRLADRTNAAPGTG